MAAELPKPRKRPRQSRSAELVRAIREACLQILEDEGPDRLTTQRIADVAGVNIASVYQYFPNKEAVLADVFEARMADLAEAAGRQFSHIQQLSQQSLEETLAAIIDMEAELLSQLYRMYPDFYLQYQHSFDIIGRVNELTQARANPSWEDWFPQFLRDHRTRLRPGDIDTQAFIARRCLESCLLAALSERPAALDQAGFRQELLTLVLRYLLSDPEAEPGTPPQIP